MRELHSAGKGVDAVTLADELTRRDQFKQIGGDDMLLAIANSVPHAANARYHAELVAQKATARRTAQAATDILQEVYSNLFTAEELHQRATNRLATIQPVHGKKEPWPELTLNQEPDALPFPLDAFPEPLQRFCLGAAIVTSAAPDITGVSMLATASAAIGQSVNLYLKRTHQESPLLYVLTVADPGRSKTPAIKLVTRPLIRIDKKLRDESQLEKQAWEEAKKMVGKQAESTPPPPPRRAVVKDVTRESLVAILAANPRGVLANPDEATAWIGSFNQYRTRGTDRQFWLDIWSSTPHAVDREGGQRSHYVATPMVTVIAGIPPDMLSSIAEDHGRNDGFRDRLLFACPGTFPKRRWIEGELDQGDETTWTATIEKLQAQTMFFDENRATVRPYIVGFNPKAKSEWVQWYDSHCAEMENPEAPAWVPGVYSKMISYCARLALILSRLRIALDPEAGPELIKGPVTEPDIRGAIKLVQYFTNHFARVEHRMTAGTGTNEAATILNWIKRKAINEFREAQIREDLRRRFPDQQSIESPIRTLTKAGAIRPKNHHQEPAKTGRRPSKTFEVNPAVHTPAETTLEAPVFTVFTENYPETPF